jgi:transcriptional regulator with XRE-family HTH domain
VTSWRDLALRVAPRDPEGDDHDEKLSIQRAQVMTARAEREALADALMSVLNETGGVQHKLATRLGMSRRTLLRYQLKRAVPSPARALAMLAALTDISLASYTCLADALHVPLHARPVHQAAAKVLDRGAEESAFALMLYRAAEAAGVPSATVRGLAVTILQHAVARGLDVSTAHAVSKTVAGR